MSPWAQPLLSVEEQAQEGRFQEKSKHAFHAQGLTDHASGETREMRPVGTKLKFHGNASHDSQHEVDAKNLGPKARRLMVSLIVTAEAQRLQHDDQRRKPHGELREEIVEGDGEGKMKAMD